MSKERVLTDVPDSDVESVMQNFTDSGCKPVTKEPQSNGKWTVRAVCPDEASKGD
jgi:hypothetical protein